MTVPVVRLGGMSSATTRTSLRIPATQKTLKILKVTMTRAMTSQTGLRARVVASPVAVFMCQVQKTCFPCQLLRATLTTARTLSVFSKCCMISLISMTLN